MTADRLSVDLPGLDLLASNLMSIRSAMNATRSMLESYRGQMGSTEIEDALGDFEHGWRDGRRKIDDNANKLATMASQSAETLRQVDSDLSAGLIQASQLASEGGGGD
ncbi:MULTISPECIES: hypothetical protein [Protofrankia]|uniref:WXG100 family type VII secretion target n=1 Tax=Protofrankia coriariae TaxID=1562887 RepID=A0ABR5F280_9ACTN|nr:MULTISPECIES: hypothetical protein [Protofrankia]KLL10825.1 hypothetical protein FrCorBMG51_15535 [Protofrankia coriariae]ONH34028.1 hypothetical protein BL254_18500 [Protofrankia sp. BMG5.30]